MKDFVRRFHRAGGVVVAGTDCIMGCGYGFADELRLLVESGLSPAESLRAATSDAAAILGWGDRVGRVAAGAAADLLVLDEDPLRDVRNVTTLRALVINGRHLDRSQLDALRASP
jgi:imidazolonepropionase-like amidohydrolase